MFKKSLMIIFIVILSLLTFGYSYADDEDTFNSVAPDALILLDLSGSMEWNPAGGSNIWGTSTCAGPTFVSSANSSNPYNCSRLEIAKRAIYSILNYDGTDPINSQDSSSLNVRIGYMRFYNGTVRLIQPISSLGADTGTSYQKTFCGSTTSCSAPSISGICSSSGMTGTTSEKIVNACATGGTPLAQSLLEAGTYLNTHKDADTKAKSCRQKFVILITDGADTYACSGNGSECQAHMYKRRRQVVAATKQLYDSGYKVFVIGLGSTMPSYLQNTLNWMAYYGGTDAGTTKTGSTSAYSIVNNCGLSSSSCCNVSTNPAACYPTGINSCQEDSATQTSSDCGSSTANFRATNNDPGYLGLGGYAFLAGNATALNTALLSVIKNIQSSAYSFSQSSIQSIRTKDENFIYEASFYPYVNTANDPLWRGYFKRYTIDTAGSISTTPDWDAGYNLLRARTAASRTIYTHKAGALTAFNSSSISMTDLGVATAADLNATINFVRGGEQVGADIGCKLGDIFHSSPITIGSPSAYFYDKIDTATPKAFETFRANHQRTSALGNRLILTGANDGQFHVFKAGEVANDGGKEHWSFIPPNFLTRLSLISHAVHPIGLLHQYFVDGPISASDVWLGTGSGASKNASDWRTLAVMAEGRGGGTTLWSQSPTCNPTAATDYGFSQSYAVTESGVTTYYPYYCGYYAFDLTETLNTPVFKWHLGGSTTALTATEGNYLGQPWSKMIMGRVNLSGNEKWVGFIGGGYSGGNITAGGSTAGKGFYVIDLSDGSIIWKFTHADDGNMVYDLAGPAATVDYDSDGFIDTAYIGDTGGNVWRFKFCLKGASGCTWSGSRFFNGASLKRPIYTVPTVTKDASNNLWVYFGTGDITDPVALPTVANVWEDKFFAIKDTDRTTERSISNLDNISTSTYNPASSNIGWYFKLNGNGEKMLAEPTAFEGIIYFTTFIPSIDNYCTSGKSYLYAVDYITGAAEFSSGTTLSGGRAIAAGDGVASMVTVSLNPYGGTNLYVSTSECSGGACTKKIEPPGSGNVNKTNILYWRDQRVQ